MLMEIPWREKYYGWKQAVVYGPWGKEQNNRQFEKRSHENIFLPCIWTILCCTHVWDGLECFLLVDWHSAKLLRSSSATDDCKFSKLLSSQVFYLLNESDEEPMGNKRFERSTIDADYHGSNGDKEHNAGSGSMSLCNIRSIADIVKQLWYIIYNSVQWKFYKNTFLRQKT